MQVGTRILTKMLNYYSLLGREIKKNWMGRTYSTYREKKCDDCGGEGKRPLGRLRRRWRMILIL